MRFQLNNKISEARQACSPDRRRRLLFVQRTLDARGGGASVAAWMLQALVREYEVTLLSWKPPDLERLNRFYGTSLRDDQMKTVVVPRVVRRVLDLDPDPGSIQSWCMMLRRCKQMRHRYDLALSAEMEADLGLPGIQYIHFPELSRFYRPNLSPLNRRRWQRWVDLLCGELRLWMVLANYSFERMKLNLTITNSDWTADLFRRVYGIEPVTLYPPAGGDFRPLPWSRRKDGFVAIGRMAACKRFDSIIEMIGRVRERKPNVKLHIVGSVDTGPEAPAYRRDLKALVQSNADWVELHENPSRAELTELLAGNRYGIHAHTAEHYGIAVAEMVVAGCLPFVYDNGGPLEIIGHDHRVTYSSDDDGVKKILAIMDDSVRQAAILSRLSERAELFTAERFMREFRSIVARHLASS